jgi:hypothetical protein
MILVTACTQRKSVEQNQALRPVNILRGPLDDVAEHWVEEFQDRDRVTAARDFYQGLAPTLARDAMAHGARWFIASAGAGLVSARTLLPAYDCTIQGRTANILRRVTNPAKATPAQWWAAIGRAVGRPAPLRSLIQAAGSDTVCLALPEAYWKMIEVECRGLPRAAKERLRLFRARGLAKVDADLAPLVMPYDARLDGPDSMWRGSRGTFSVRAAHHFLTTIAHLNPQGAASEHAALVAEALLEWRAPKKPKLRAPATDKQVKTLIRDLHRRGISAPTTQLKHIRSVRKFACEQSRFERLRREVLHA